jgi:pimeloyl-ACP methyl ester carboxylesterase
MAYWDQRLAGSSGGTADLDQLTYAQFADDLRQVVLLLRKQYPDKKIYLLGHSFGVEMAWQFLTTGDNQNLVDGFIAMDGTYSTFEWLLDLQQWIADRALETGDQEAYDYISNIVLTRENMQQTVEWGEWYQRIFRLDGNPVWPSDDPGYDANLWFASPHSRFSEMLNSGSYDNYYNEEIFRFDCKSKLAQVTIPVHIFWGVKDGIMPLSHAYRTAALLPGTPEPVLFQNSWHSPFHTETERFVEELVRATD